MRRLIVIGYFIWLLTVLPGCRLITMPKDIWKAAQIRNPRQSWSSFITAAERHAGNYFNVRGEKE